MHELERTCLLKYIHMLVIFPWGLGRKLFEADGIAGLLVETVPT